MIVFDLRCASEHSFEGWFASAEDYSGQRTRGMLACPVCGSPSVDRVPSPTRINLGVAPAGGGAVTTPGAQMTAALPAPDPGLLLSRLIDEVLRRTEDVGSEFPSEARKIFHEEAPPRAIRGLASQEEHEALVEEGIPVARLPIPPTGRWN